VIEAKLFNLTFADAIRPAVSNVANPGAFGPKKERRSGGSHTGKFAILLAAGMNTGVGFNKSFAKGVGRPVFDVFSVGVGDDADRKLAGEFADRVRAHAVGHQEDMTSSAPLLFIASQRDGVVVLIVAATDPHVAQARVLD
jgi:hypothetical protein